jgi:hypothetical protein
MKANFYLGFEFGYMQDTIEVQIIARTDSPDYMIIKLPEGYNPVMQDFDTVAVCRDFLEIESEDSLKKVPMWDANQESEFRRCIQ